MPVAPTQELVVSKLQAFRDWVKAHCKGRERGEAQIFLNHFFQCFGYDGVLEAGGTFEYAQKSGSRKGNTGFFDCLFPGYALIEMKQRGAALNEHYNQLLTYWTYCTPKPTVGILCNFDEFWIYDFNVQVDTPVQVLTLDELSEHPEALLFMLGQTPRFQQNMVDITEGAAAEISKLYRSILARREKYHASEEDVQRFVLQCVLCLFAEDIGLLPDNLFTDLLDDCRKKPGDTYNLLHGLFTQMNTKRPAPGGRFKDVKYFNGGLFQTITPIELDQDELEGLYRLGYDYKWQNVRPSIFGTIFEKAIGHHQGSHFTSEVDIYKIVNPTIVRYWDERIEAAGDNVKQLHKCLSDLRKYRVLDPACGSGNFLYIAFQELKRLEKQLMERSKYVVATSPQNFTANDTKGTDISLVSPMQFYGIELKPFAVELARLTLEIGRKVAVNKFDLPEDVLPLDNLNKNIVCEDALFSPWPEAEAIIGNPPFIGKRHLIRDMGEAYIEKVRQKYSDISADADFCAYWFHLAGEHSANRAGLVGTNSIAQGLSRRAALDPIFEKGGLITNAVSTQIWSGEANVHVSIVNWLKNWTKKDVNDFYLDDMKVKLINSSLKAELDITTAHRLDINKKKSFQGVNLAGKGFIVDEATAKKWIATRSRNSEVLKPMLDGDQWKDPNKRIQWVIDFHGMSIEAASLYAEPFEIVKALVQPYRANNRRENYKKYWWLFAESRPGLRYSIKDLYQYFSIPQIAKYTNFRPIDMKILPCEAMMIVASDDFYILGILNSKLHREWVKAQASTLKGDTRYTNTTCFETFPFLWDAPDKLKQPVREIMIELEAYRMNEMKTRQWGITKLYNAFFNEPASQLYKLHCKLDEAVCKVYDWKYDPEKNYNEDLFYLNQRLYEKEQAPLAKGLAKKPRTKKPG